MAITSITVRFMRRKQVRDYEPMEAEITATLTVEEGEEVPSAAGLLIETKEAVMQGLRHQITGNLVTVTAAEDNDPISTVSSGDDPGPEAAPVRERGKPSFGKKRRTAAEVAEDAELDAAEVEGGVDDPNQGRTDVDDLGPKASVDPADVGDLGPTDPAASGAGIDTSMFDITEGEAPISDAELLKIAAAGASGIGAEDVRKIIKGFGVKQLIQLNADQREVFRVSVNDKIAAAKT